MFELIVSSTTILGNILLALFVYFNNRKSATNVLFSIIAIAFSGVALGTFLATRTNIPATAIFWVRVNMFFAAIVTSALFPFLHTYPNDKITINKKLLVGILFWAIILSILCFTPLIFKEARFDPNLNTIPGPGIVLFGITLFINMGLGFFFLLRKYRKSKGLVRSQIQFLGLGLLASFGVLSILNFLTVILLKDTSFVNIGISSIIIFISATTYAIVRHRLLDIRLIVARTITYALLATVLFASFITITLVSTSVFLKTSLSIGQVIFYSALTLLIAYISQPLKQIFQTITDKIFFKEDYDSNALLGTLTKIMAEKILIDDIAHSLLTKIIEEMRITRGAFVLTDGGKIFVSETQGYKEEPKFSEKDIFSIQALDKNLVFEDLEESPAKELMRKLNVTVVIPLKTQVDHVGVLLLGEKASGEIYSQKDIKVLEIFSPEASISFENAKSVEKIRRFNITLKEQVERATHDLRNANEQLKDLDRMKDEFLSVASHDLRTPMTAIKGYLWMALNDRAGKIENQDLRRYLEISYTSAERMITLINDLLNVSRIKAGRVQMIFEDLAIKPIMDQIFAEIMSKADEKKIELKYTEAKDTPHVIVDKQRMPEIMQNLIGNALKFTPEKGKITVDAKLAKEKGFVEISVTDTGVGLSKEDQAKLFEKYGRVEHSYTAANTSGGTGLGLYITKNYVEMLGGKIWIESEVGKGSTFAFTLKIADSAEIKKMNEAVQKKEAPASVPQTTTTIAAEAAKTAVPAKL